jgi:hypothetical protein
MATTTQKTNRIQYRMAIKNLSFLFFLFVFFKSTGQTYLNKLALFGIEYKPIMAGDFIGKSETNLVFGNFNTNFKQVLGHSYGANIRVVLTPGISIETGIHMVKRNYTVSFYEATINLTSSKQISFLNYDIPIIPYFFIKLSDKIYLANGLGPAFVFSLSDVATQSIASSTTKFVAEGRRTHRLAVDLSANLGFEYRTQKNGYFYIGGNARVPFAPIFKVAGILETINTQNKTVVIGNMSGTYISFDFKYYFPTNTNKQEPLLKGPID